MTWSSSWVILSLTASFFFFHALYSQRIAAGLDHRVDRRVIILMLLAQPRQREPDVRLVLIGHLVIPILC